MNVHGFLGEFKTEKTPHHILTHNGSRNLMKWHLTKNIQFGKIIVQSGRWSLI